MIKLKPQLFAALDTPDGLATALQQVVLQKLSVFRFWVIRAHNGP